MNYEIEYKDEKGVHTERFNDLPNVGTAFAECLIKHPNATLLRGICSSVVAWSEFWIEYAPPPVSRNPVKQPRPARAPGATDDVPSFPFYSKP